MAGRQGHFFDIGGVPGGDHEPAGIRIGPDFVLHPCDLINGLPVWSRPRAPLVTINRAQFAVGVGPIVPYGNAVLAEPFDVGISPEKPQEFDNNRAQVELFSCQAGKALGQIETHLMPKNAPCSRTGAVAAVGAARKNSVQKIQVNTHGGPRA